MGLTHASIVIALLRSSPLESAIVTSAFVPLKDNARPYRPAVDQVVLDSVPV